MSYFTGEQVARIRVAARLSASEDLWSFLHSMILFAMLSGNSDLVAEMRPTRGRDGAFRGLLLINEFAELLEIALEEHGDNGNYVSVRIWDAELDALIAKNREDAETRRMMQSLQEKLAGKKNAYGDWFLTPEQLVAARALLAALENI